MRKILSCLMIFIFCLLCFAGCAKKDDGVPEGMYSVTREGEPFILYVPGDWTDNRDSGYSSAYLINDGVVVSARYYPLAQGDDLSAYITRTVEAYSSEYSGFKPIDRDTKAMLGGKNAEKYQFTFDRTATEGGNAVNTTVTQYYAEHKGDVILLSFYCISSRYNENYARIFEQIRSEFVLRDKKVQNGGIVDGDTPEGMKRVSFEGCEYLFYAPKEWSADMTDKLTEAKCKEHGCNITVTAFLPDGELTVEDYFKLCQESYKKELGSYELLSGLEGKTAGKTSHTYIYKAVVDGTEYRFEQTVLYFNDMFYSITYTARAEHFDSHSEAVDRMLAEFKFH